METGSSLSLSLHLPFCFSLAKVSFSAKSNKRWTLAVAAAAAGTFRNPSAGEDFKDSLLRFFAFPFRVTSRPFDTSDASRVGFPRLRGLPQDVGRDRAHDGIARVVINSC